MKESRQEHQRKAREPRHDEKYTWKSNAIVLSCSKPADKKRWVNSLKGKVSQRAVSVWEEISKTVQRLHQWKTHEFLVRFMASSRMSSTTEHNRDAHSAKGALLCTETLTVSHTNDRKRQVAKVLQPYRRIRSNQAVCFNTIRVSRNATTVVTANGEVQMNEEATVHVNDLDLFLTLQVFEDTPAALTLGKLCKDHGYFYEQTSVQKLHH